ncbi:MAG: alpha/beta fold hydrolase [Bdellovibrionales bacterium]|nr:alpha/beta fold hydrolase [Bdellovibrionales bacterium]
MRELTERAKDQQPPVPLPKFLNVLEEYELTRKWLGLPVDLGIFKEIVPNGVTFISHSLYESASKSAVKFDARDGGHATIMRAEYKIKVEENEKTVKTNVTFSNFGLKFNLGKEQKWLIGPEFRAGILFLHGGGTKSAGGHVAAPLINYFAKYNIPVISPDLPWHGEGPRMFMDSFDGEIEAIFKFVKKYVHPKVPLFVWGHSFGGTLAHRLMQIVNENNKDRFHNNLKGLIITSPGIDPVPVGSGQEKLNAFRKLREQSMNNSDVSPMDKDIFNKMISDGKVSPIGNFFASLILAQLDDTGVLGQLDDTRVTGRKYLPALMIVGTGDPLVYVGLKEKFENYFDNLKNVEKHYLNELPLFTDGNEKIKVGHLLSDYTLEGEKEPVNFSLGRKFIIRVLAELQYKKSVQEETETKDTLINKKTKEIETELREAKDNFSIFEILRLYSNDLAFRQWVETESIVIVTANEPLMKYIKDLENKKKDIESFVVTFLHPKRWLYSWLKDNNRKESVSEEDMIYMLQFQSFISDPPFVKFVKNLNYSRMINSFLEEGQVLNNIKPFLNQNENNLKDFLANSHLTEEKQKEFQSFISDSYFLEFVQNSIYLSKINSFLEEGQFLNNFKPFLGQNENNLTGFLAKYSHLTEEKQKEFQSFISDSDFVELDFDKFVKALNKVENYSSEINHFIENNVVSSMVGRKSERSFLNTFNTFLKQNDLTGFFNEYFYITEEKQKELQSLIADQTELERKINGTYIFSFEEVLEFKEKNFLEEKAKEIFQEIKINVQNRINLQRKLKELDDTISQRKQYMNNNNIQKISQYIKKVNNFLSEFQSNPTLFKKEFKNLEEKFNELYETWGEMTDTLEAEIIPLLGSGNFTLDNLNKIINEHRDIIVKYEILYNTYVEMRKKIRQAVIDAVLEGKLETTEEEKEAFEALYKNLGLYKVTESASLELAKDEASYLKLQKQEAESMQKYYSLSPFETLKDVTIIPVKDLLNRKFVSQDTGENILKEFGFLQSRTLPPLPE